MNKDPMQVLYHVTKVMEERGSILTEMQKDLHSIKIDIEVMKQTGLVPRDTSEIRKERAKDGATGGGIAALLMGIVYGVIEYIKAKGG